MLIFASNIGFHRFCPDSCRSGRDNIASVRASLYRRR